MHLGSGDDITNGWEGDWGKAERKERKKEGRPGIPPRYQLVSLILFLFLSQREQLTK